MTTLCRLIQCLKVRIPKVSVVRLHHSLEKAAKLVEPSLTDKTQLPGTTYYRLLASLAVRSILVA